MISPEAGQAWFRLIVFIIIVAIGLLFVVPPGSAEFVITVLTLVIGILFLGLLVYLLRRANR